MTQIFQADLDGAIGSAEARVKRSPQARDRGPVDEISCAGREDGESAFRCAAFTGQELALGSVEFEIEAQSVLSLPTVFGQEGATLIEIGKSRGIGRRVLGTPARYEIECSDLRSLLRRGNQGRAAVELVGDFEDLLLDLFRRRPRRERSTDSQVH